MNTRCCVEESDELQAEQDAWVAEGHCRHCWILCNGQSADTVNARMHVNRGPRDTSQHAFWHAGACMGCAEATRIADTCSENEMALRKELMEFDGADPREDRWVRHTEAIESARRAWAFAAIVARDKMGDWTT